MKKYILALLAIMALTPMARSQRQNGGITLTPAQKIAYAESLIENYYVEDVDGDSIAREAIVAMLKTLDPHSAYSTPEETKALNEPLEGKFSGIGIQFNYSTDTVYVVQTVPGGPSEKVGLRPGDRIIMADDSVIAGKKIPQKEIVKILRGPKDSKVRLSVLRAGDPKLIEFVVTRDDIPLNSVNGTYMAAPGVGYIYLSRFAENSGEEVAEAIAKLKAQGMKSLILDLQDNTGGFLNAAFDIASLFLEQGDLVVYTQGKDGEPHNFYVEDKKPFFDGPVTVLINQYSASASEIVSGALQDNDRGTIVGRRSFGKGLVQRPFAFPDGSMMRLTISRYYTPAGRCIQKHYEKGHGEEYQLDMLNRYESGELWSADSIHFDESQKFQTLKKGRTVYGGGGIMPDVFVPVDTAYYTPYYRDLQAKGVIPQFSLSYIDKNRKQLLKQYPNEDVFFEKYQVSPETMQEIIAKAEAEGVEFNQEQFDISRPIIEGIFRGYLARDIYQDGNYIRFVNQFNPVFVEGLKIAKSEQ